MRNKTPARDPFLDAIVKELQVKYKCHTVILYGSRARGDWTEQSDYDLLGVKKSGKKVRLGQKREGKYLDVFIFPQSKLKKLTEDHLYMNGGKVLVETKGYGTKFLKRLKAQMKKPFKPWEADQIETHRTWAHKTLERVQRKDIEANWRRSWLHEALLLDYFSLRKKRFLGSKAAFSWLKKNDPGTYRLFDKVLKRPTDLKLLARLVERVTQR